MSAIKSACFSVLASVMKTLKRPSVFSQLAAGVTVSFTLLPATALLADNLRITHGGTYSGAYAAADANPAAVEIDTSEPVVLQDCILTGQGPYVVAPAEHTNIKLIRVHARGTLPTRSGERIGRFLAVQNPDSLEVTDCDLERTAGIYVLGFGTRSAALPTIWIHDNRVHNIDGRIGGDLARGHSAIVQFVQLDKVRHVSGIDVSWNQVINDPGDSAVEDVISIYKSSGIPDSPIRIHDNYIRGAYPVDPKAAGYSGGGIMLGDGAEANPADGPGYVEAFNNQVLDTTNYGIAISAGHHCTFHDNRIISSGLLPDLRAGSESQNVGAYIWNSNKKTIPKANFHDNGGRRNLIGWTRGTGRNDWWMPDATFWELNERITGPVTRQTVTNEWKRWQEKLKAHQATTKP